LFSRSLKLITCSWEYASRCSLVAAINVPPRVRLRQDQKFSIWFLLDVAFDVPGPPTEPEVDYPGTALSRF